MYLAKTLALAIASSITVIMEKHPKYFGHV